MGASLVAQTVTNVRAMQETQVRSLGQEGAWEKEMATTPVSCLENSTDRGFWWASPWGRKESDMIERLTFSELIYNIVLVSGTQQMWFPFCTNLLLHQAIVKELIVSDY